MPSTASGIVYPASTDPPEAWTAMGNMAASLETLIASLVNPPRARIHNSGNVATANNTITIMTMDTSDYDTDTMVDLANNQLVVKTAGVYAISGQIAWTANATGARDAYLYAGASGAPGIIGNDQRATLGAATATVQQVYAEVELNVNDVIQLRGSQTSTAALNASASNASLWLAAHRIGALV